jgi:tetratricopeptide (TPR) repeat protein
MRHPLVWCALLLLTTALRALAQMDAGDTDNSLKRPVVPSQAPIQMFISGKVVLEDGSPLPDKAEIETVCDGQKRKRARTDSRGGFSFRLSSDGGSDGAETQSAATGADTSWGGPMAPRRDEPDVQGCELEAVLSGFTSEKVQLGRRATSFGDNNVGQIVLHRMGQAEGLTISVTSAQAPEDARKAFKKGLEEAQKNKWEEAQAAFEKAVKVYPKYAIAWFELGRVQAQQKNLADAKRCWEQAVSADSKYVLPYQMLAQAAAGESNWPKLTEFSAAWLALDPVDFVDAWFLNAVGNYFGGSLDSAENSARQGIKLDQAHRIPKLQYVLGMALLKKQSYAEAAQHMQLYLHLVNKPADVNEAQKQLGEIERLSASASVAGSGEKQ